MNVRTVVLPALCLAALGGQEASSATTKHGYGVRFDLGTDSNPRRLAGDGSSGAFGELRVDGQVERSIREHFVLFADGKGWSRQHDSGAQGADIWGIDLRAGFLRREIAAVGGRMSVAFGLGHSIDRSTFIDRLTGVAYEVEVPGTPGSYVAIPNRFDRAETGLFADARWVGPGRLGLFARAGMTGTNYIDDYTRSAGLSSLDNRSTRIEPGVSWRASRAVELLGSVAVESIDYRERPAQNESGDEVQGTTTEYRDAELRLSLRLTPGDRWQARFGLSSADRTDSYASYGDFSSWNGWFVVDRRLGPSHQIEFAGSIRDLSHDQAVVSTLENGQLRSQRVQRWIGRHTQKLNATVRWISEVGTQSADSSDPELTHDRRWITTGFEIRR